MQLPRKRVAVDSCSSSSSSSSSIQPFSIEGLEFDGDNVWVCHVNDTLKHFPCERHSIACINSTDENAPFIFKQSTVNNEAVLSAHIIQMGMTSCVIGYITLPNLPKATIDFMVESLYQLSSINNEEIDESTIQQQHHGVVKGVRIGKANNRLLN